MPVAEEVVAGPPFDPLAETEERCACRMTAEEVEDRRRRFTWARRRT
jgi:hypothetical protein